MASKYLLFALFISNTILCFIWIASIVFISKTIKYTISEPFKEEIAEDKYNYFFSNDSIVSQKIILNFNLVNKRKIFNRIIDKKCINYQNEIMSNNKTLNDIFNFNTNFIHFISIGLVVMLSINFILIIMYFLIILFSIIIPSSCFCIFITLLFWRNKILAIYIPIFICIIISGLLIILFIKYLKSDIKDYLYFLKCPNVNKEGFEKFLYAENLKRNLVISLILNIIFLIFNQITILIYAKYNKIIQEEKENQEREREREEKDNIYFSYDLNLGDLSCLICLLQLIRAFH